MPMHFLVCLLAQADFVREAPRATPLPKLSSSSFGSEVAGILSIALVLAAALFCWAFFLRKRQHPDPHVRTLQEGSVFSGNSSGHQPHRHHSRRRRRRRHHPHHEGTPGPRNPTLHETGGLPPVRSEDDFPRI